MEFGLGVQLDDPQLRKMTFAGNIWLSFGNVFQLWQQFLVLVWLKRCRFFVFSSPWSGHFCWSVATSRITFCCSVMEPPSFPVFKVDGGLVDFVWASELAACAACMYTRFIRLIEFQAYQKCLYSGYLYTNSKWALIDINWLWCLSRWYILS